MRRQDVIQYIFQERSLSAPKREKGLAYAPTNIALCKYWGKRNCELNLPVTSSLSIALPDKGALTSLTLHDEALDKIVLNGRTLLVETYFQQRVTEFLDLFRPQESWRLHIDINMNIPVAAGLASSACGIASLVSAMNDLFDWHLSKRDLSLLARLGSGSASRSLWLGFVEWHAGVQANGMDSYAEPLSIEWSNLYIGILPISHKEKLVSSRDAMERTVYSSTLYSSWPKKASQDLQMIKQALQSKNFSLLGGVAESNALAMHATILSSWPPVCYFLPETVAAMQEVWAMRQEGTEVYFTEDAGPNLKLLFLEQNKEKIQARFPKMELVKLFE